MAAATTDQNTEVRADKAKVRHTRLLAEGAVIHGGTLVGLNPDGFLEEPNGANTLHDIKVSAGPANNQNGLDGAVHVNVESNCEFLFNNSDTDPVSQADLGKACYAQDNQTIAGTDGSGSRPQAGIVTDIESRGVWIKV